MSKNKILIVEDERITAEDLKNTLENLGYYVTGIASSANTFYSCLKSEMPDLVIMDIYLKGDKDGIELASEIKETYQLPVIYLTAYSDSEILDRAKVTEPFGYILKPFQERELHSNIEMALHKNRMEKRINHLNAILKAIRDVNQLIVKVSDASELLKKTCETLISTLAYSSSWFLVLDPNGELVEAASAGLSGNFDDFTAKYREGFRPDCINFLDKNNVHIYSTEDVRQCTGCPASDLYPETGSIIAKVQYQDRLFGYLNVTMSDALINDSEELALFTEISDDLGLALNNLEQKKRKEYAEEALRQSETRFRHAFDYGATSMCIVGMDGKFQKINEAFTKLLEYHPDEIQLLHFNDITHPDDLELGVDVMRKLINGDIETASFEKRYISKNRNTVYAHVSASLIRDELNQPKHFITHMVDLSIRKLAEQNLIDSKEQYSTFMNSTSDLACLKDDQFRYVMTNKKLAEFLKLPEAEILGKTDFEIMPYELAHQCNLSDRMVLENMESAVTKEPFGDRIYESHKFPVRLKGGTTGIGAFIRDVTEQIKAEEENLRLSQVVQQSPDSIVVTDFNGIIEYVNPASGLISGYTQQELIGNNPSILSSGETPKEEYKALWDTIKSGNEWKGEFHNRKKNGELYWERASISPIKNQKGEITHFLGIKEDITERKRSEKIQQVLFNISKQVIETSDVKQLLEIIRNELSTLINTKNFQVAFFDENTGMLNSAYGTDEKDAISRWPAEKSLTGYIIKHNKSLLLRKEDFARLEKSGEIELIGSDSEIWLGVPLVVNGKSYGAFIIQDYQNEKAYNESDLIMLEFIASQVSLSIQRQKSIVDLQHALVKAEAGDKLKTAFINNISHEIRTPLNGILGFSEMTLNPDSTPEDNELFYSIIKKSSKRLLNTVTSYMDISMLVSGTMEIIRRPSNLNKLGNEIYADFEDQCSQKGIVLKNMIADSAEGIIMQTDIEKIRKIIAHLLDNAVKFTQKGSISFGYVLKNTEVEYFVEDTGAGINQDALNVIFDAFMQADVSSTRGYEGSGLGLTIANGMVKLLGGKLWVETERGSGSTFYFTLPIAENPMVTQRKVVEPLITEPTAKPLILVAEDDDSNYKYTEIVLLYSSYDVIRAENGFEAVECCRTHPEIRLVLMDIKMPLMDGFEATRQIKSFRPDLPVIALTAHVTTEDENAAISAGCNEYVTKPVSKNRLLEIIQNCISLSD